jgi:YegS/Rv2252/BmrU family lipid kinase
LPGFCQAVKDQKWRQLVYRVGDPQRGKSLKTVFIINPNAGNRRAAKFWPDIQRTMERSIGGFETFFTEGAGDAVNLTRRVALKEPRRLVCVGGDGTLNEVVNGMMKSDIGLRRKIVLGYIPCGTGCDFTKTARLSTDPLEAAIVAVTGKGVKTIDVGRLAFRDAEGRNKHLFFHNVASFGLGGEVDDRVNRSNKMMGGFISFIFATLVSIFLYKKKVIHLRMDEGPLMKFNAWNVVVANGQYHGGGMWVARDAALDDGFLKVVVIGDFTLPEVFRHLPKLYNGRLYSHGKVGHFRARRIEAWSTDKVLLDVDGEQPGRLPAIADIVPEALTMAVT